MLVPIAPWVREQLNIIEAFVRDHVMIPNELLSNWPYQGESLYKPMHDGRNMFMPVGLKCVYTTDLGCNTTSFPTYRRPQFGAGRYIFTFEVPHVYIGPHKSGHLYSLNFRVSRIHYEPCTATVPQPMSQPMMTQPIMSQPQAMSQPMMPQSMLTQAMYSAPMFSPVLSPPKDILKDNVSFPDILPTHKDRVKPVRSRRKHAIVGDSQSE